MYGRCHEQDRARAFGMIGAAFGLGFIAGPALSGALAHISIAAPVWAAAITLCRATLMAWFVAAEQCTGRRLEPACRFAICPR